MKNKYFLLPLLVLATAMAIWGVQRIESSPQRILRRMSDYYRGVSSFEGTVTIVAGSAPRQTVDTRQFTFQRPNKFVIVWDANAMWGTHRPELLCNGTNIYDYRPYYYNSYTRAPAASRFEQMINNRVGGEMLRMIANTNPYAYAMSGFGRGLMDLRYEGRQRTNGGDCARLYFQEPGSKTAELWIARGPSPYAVKYEAHFPEPGATNQVMDYTETISGWKANAQIPVGDFIFTPSAGAVEHGSDRDRVETTATTTADGVERESVKFIPSDGKSDGERLADFLKNNGERFRALALKSILAKHKNLATGDLAFLDVQPSPFYPSEKTFVATFAVLATVKTTNTSNSVEQIEQTFSVTLSPSGQVDSVSKGTSMSFRPRSK